MRKMKKTLGKLMFVGAFLFSGVFEYFGAAVIQTAEAAQNNKVKKKKNRKSSPKKKKQSNRKKNNQSNRKGKSPKNKQRAKPRSKASEKKTPEKTKKKSSVGSALKGLALAGAATAKAGALKAKDAAEKAAKLSAEASKRLVVINSSVFIPTQKSIERTLKSGKLYSIDENEAIINIQPEYDEMFDKLKMKLEKDIEKYPFLGLLTDAVKASLDMEPEIIVQRRGSKLGIANIKKIPVPSLGGKINPLNPNLKSLVKIGHVKIHGQQFFQINEDRMTYRLVTEMAFKKQAMRENSLYTSMSKKIRPYGDMPQQVMLEEGKVYKEIPFTILDGSLDKYGVNIGQIADKNGQPLAYFKESDREDGVYIKITKEEFAKMGEAKAS